MAADSVTADLAAITGIDAPTGLLIGGQWSIGTRRDARRDQSGHRGRDHRGGRREPGGRAGGGRCRGGGVAGLGRQAAAGARRVPAPGLRADDAAVRAAGPADGAGERQGAAGRARRDPVRGRVLPLVRRGSGPDRRAAVDRAVRRQPDHGAAPACRRQLHDHAVELPGRDGHPEDRAGPGRRLHRRAQAGQGDPADCAGGGRASWPRPACPTASSTSCPRTSQAR